MNEPPDLLRTVLQWVEKAEHDLLNVEHTLTLEEDGPFDTVCFHAQQCAEKYIKAIGRKLGEGTGGNSREATWAPLCRDALLRS